MRSITILIGALTVIGLVAALTPTIEARPAPACTDLKGTCPGFVCVDENLDGRFQWNECVVMYCLHGCCGSPCPPPDWD